MRGRHAATAGGWLLAATLLTTSATAQEIDRLVTLGDSASDAGNLQLLLSGLLDPTPASAGIDTRRPFTIWAKATLTTLQINTASTLLVTAAPPSHRRPRTATAVVAVNVIQPP